MQPWEKNLISLRTERWAGDYVQTVQKTYSDVAKVFNWCYEQEATAYFDCYAESKQSNQSRTRQATHRNQDTL
jgi:hypothetical protein